MTGASIRIGTRTIGRGHPALVVAELSANHGGEKTRALETIEAAAESGADAVKLQTYTPDTLTIDCDGPQFTLSDTLWQGRTLYDLYREAHTPWEWHADLFERARKLGLLCFSTAFDPTAVDFLERFDVPAYKVASFENVDLPLLRKVAATGKPVIMSTGMATLAEIDEAVDTLRRGGAGGVALLKCTSAYPASPAQVNLRTIDHLAEAFDVPAGLSDHTLTTAVAVAAVSLGATIIEKHFTLSRADGGPDHAFSLEPAELRRLVDDVRVTEAALGTVAYGPTDAERSSLVFRRSLFVVAAVRAGERFTVANVRPIRPGYGLGPKWLSHVLGRRAVVDLPRGTPLTWDVVGGPDEN